MFEALVAVVVLALLSGMSSDEPAPPAPDPGVDEPDDDEDEPETVGLPGTPTAPKPVVPNAEDMQPEPDGFGLSGQDALPDVAGPSAADVVDSYLVTDVPLGGGKLLSLTNATNPGKVARGVLGVNPGHPAVAPYIRAMTEVAYNLAVYGTPWDPANPNHPKWSAIDVGGGDMWVTQSAWLPRHWDVAALLRQGILPARNVDHTEKANRVDPDGTSYGDIWLPRAKVEGDELVILDLEPPPELRHLMGDEIYV